MTGIKWFRFFVFPHSEQISAPTTDKYNLVVCNGDYYDTCRWGRTQQNISTNPILQVSVPNKPTKSVSIQLSPNRQQNPQQRRLSNKVFQVSSNFGVSVHFFVFTGKSRGPSKCKIYNLIQ